MPHLFRPGLTEIAAYRPGKPAPIGPGGQSIKLSSNESPFLPLPSVLSAISTSIPNAVHRYPNLAAPQLTQLIATRFGVAPENVALGAGSVEVAAQLMHALTTFGDEVIYAWRSFEAYPILARVSGAVPVQVVLDHNYRHDLRAMAAAITDRTRLIFICNPNNPTGTVVSAADVHLFLQQVPEHVLVVIDEAYVHFDQDPESPNGIELFREYPNVAVLHTFSKAYGLAGLRVGYAIAREDVIAALRKTAIPFAVSELAQVAAVASLSVESETELVARTQFLISERDRVERALTDLGLPVVPSQANFVWLALGHDSAPFAERCERAGIAVRCFPMEGVRISIGSSEENDVFILAAQNASKEQFV